MNRRALLAAIAGLAGCGGRPASSSSPTTAPETTFTAAEADCTANTEDAATVTVEGTRFDVTGDLVAPSPCHGARLGEATVTDGTLRVAVETTDPPPDTVCAACVATVEYEATVRLGATPDRVVVTHDGEPVART